ncbi:VOC family protein [Pedobacter psychroterrae]|uniref:VOC family protein n=1 Tax=Pedobacter psychroterrae TaxID=2530453 RepID=A0A4R0NPE6_9SPHI|nr:VOC family protein [Pedobacter psychroterrae]TCD02862.1 VOC family protein [Pedobacter psychroterrae]
MNKYSIFCFLFFFAMFSSKISLSQNTFSSKLISIGVVVSDLDRSMDFYLNGIGMVKTSSFNLDKDFTKRSGLTGGVPVTVNVLKLENSPEANEWKIMSFGKSPSHPKQKFVQDDTGMQYITINVKSLRPVMERLKKLKVSLLGNTPTPLNKDLHFLLVQDPDGNFVELIGALD